MFLNEFQISFLMKDSRDLRFRYFNFKFIFNEFLFLFLFFQ